LQHGELKSRFSGHLGDPTVEHVAHHLPIIVRDFLRTADDATLSGVNDGQGIADLFRDAIQAFDNAIAKDVLDLFGGSLETLEQYEDADIQEIINDWEEGGVNYRKVRLCMYGTTALVALVDPEHQHLWVANLGDCQASELFLFLGDYGLMFGSFGVAWCGKSVEYRASNTNTKWR